MEPETTYRQRIAQAEKELRQIKNSILRISGLRVLLFMAGVIGIISFYRSGAAVLCGIVVVTFVPFLGLVKYHNRLFLRKDWLETGIRVSRLQTICDKKLRILSVYAELIRLIEAQDMHAPWLRTRKADLCTREKQATAILKALSRELERLDLRNNQILYILLEGSLFWQLRQVMRIEQWRQKYGAHLLCWLDTLGEIDALCSLAAFAYNHPAYIFPTIADAPFVFRAKDMGHPLMPTARCVTNSTDKQKGSFALIRQFMELNANGIIATHDLLLGRLTDHFPKEIRNFCFDADIVNDELVFSYKLREGIARNMNACFLMKKMGLAIPD